MRKVRTEFLWRGRFDGLRRLSERRVVCAGRGEAKADSGKGELEKAFPRMVGQALRRRARLKFLPEVEL